MLVVGLQNAQVIFFKIVRTANLTYDFVRGVFCSSVLLLLSDSFLQSQASSQEKRACH